MNQFEPTFYFWHPFGVLRLLCFYRGWSLGSTSGYCLSSRWDEEGWKVSYPNIAAICRNFTMQLAKTRENLCGKFARFLTIFDGLIFSGARWSGEFLAPAGELAGDFLGAGGADDVAFGN